MVKNRITTANGTKRNWRNCIKTKRNRKENNNKKVKNFNIPVWHKFQSLYKRPCTVTEMDNENCTMSVEGRKL